MPGLSASQEMQLEYVTWQPPESPPIVMRRRAMEGVHHEVSNAFAAAPHRCAGTGGILLGSHEADRIVVEDFEPVPSEHRFGPSYRLSDTDLALLQETLDWFRSGAQPGLSVLGFYRSHTLPDFALCGEDRDLMRSYFAAGEDLVLLVKPGLMGASDRDFSFSRCERAPQSPPPPQMAWPAPRPRRSRAEADPASPSARRWPWYLAAALLGLVGGALGFLWWHPHAGVERMAVARLAPPPALASPSARPVIEGAPAPPELDTAPIHQLLDRWAAALKRGDVAAAAQCYAPLVANYFNRRDVTRDTVTQTMRQARARYGRLDSYRISGIGIAPESDGRAVATFRKHWQLAGRAKSSGDEEERMTLVRAAGTWQISSEQVDPR